jgi:hypothetical protein
MKDDLAKIPRRSALAELAVAKGMPAAPPALPKSEEEEETCSAFGFLRGVRERGVAVEFRFLDGRSLILPYGLLNDIDHIPSAGVLLTFSGCVITLVLIHGSNLNVQVSESGINLTDRGLQRHRITFIREMDEEELRQAGNRQPTIDRIEVAKCKTPEDAEEWLKRHASVFVLQNGQS